MRGRGAMPKRVLLINAEYPKTQYEFIILPTGLGYLSESLQRAGIENRIYDPALDGGSQNVREKIKQFAPDLIGYSMMSFGFRHNYEIISAIKKEFPALTIVAGGPHISTFKKDVLLQCRAIDIAVPMEGEEALLEFCIEKPLSTIAGIMYRENEKVIETPQRALVEDLDAIPFPRYHTFDMNKYPRAIPLVTSRGCPYQCIFCPIASVMGRGFRVRSFSSVVDEIEFWHEKGFRDFSIADDVFNFNKERVYAICDEIKKRNLLGLRIRCSNGIRADRVDRALLMTMKEAGFYCLAFGVESASDRILTILKKGETREKIERAIRQACELGFWVELFFLIGAPGETMADIKESIKLSLRYPVYNANFYNLIPFPHSELYRWIEEKNYFLFPQPEYLNNVMHHVNAPLFTTPELTQQERKKAFRYAKRVINRHTKARRLKFEKWLTKEKLRDYYNKKGFIADLIAWLYCHRWPGKLMKLLSPQVRKA